MTPEEKEFTKKINSFVSDLPENTPLSKKIMSAITTPNEAQRLGRRAFSNQFFSLLLRTISPFAAFHKSALAGTFGLSSATEVVNELNNNLNRASNISIYNKTINQLTEEVIKTMPEIERETKSRILEKNMNRIANSVIDHIHTKFRKYSSYVGLAGSSIAIASLNPWLLPLGLPAYLTGQYLAHKRKNIEKTVFPFEFRARQNVWDQQDKSIRNPEVHFITADKKKQSEDLEKAQKDLFEITEVRRKKQLPLILLSAGVTTALTGVALASGWGTMGLGALVGTYAATNAFLGSIQSWVSANYNQQEVLQDLMRNYNEIKHTPNFDLQTGKEKLPQNVDTIHIDKIQYHYRKSDLEHQGERQEKPTLDFSSSFYFRPGINVLGGVSGAGKTTLYKMMRHADDLSRGSISFGTIRDNIFKGKELTDISLEEANKPIAFSLPELRHTENITGLELIKASNPKLSQDTLKELAKLFEVPLYSDKECKHPKSMDSMSSGEKKRVLCISALVSPKKILVLDEPTSGVDPLNVDRILSAINELGKEKTIIYTTHHPEELRKLNITNIVDLEQKKTKEGEKLPTDVKVYPCSSKGDIEKYIHVCQHREPKKEKKEPEKTKSISRILSQNIEETEGENTAQKNVFLKDMHNKEGAVQAAHLHEVLARSQTTEKKSPIMQRVMDKMALESMKKKVDAQKHKRIFKKLNSH